MPEPEGGATARTVDAGKETPPGSPHVCFLTSSAPLGPGDSYSPFILELAEGLGRRGFRVTILMPHVAGSATREVMRGVRVRRYRYLPRPSAETLGMGGGMLPGLRERRLDLLKVPFLLWGQDRSLRALHGADPIRLLHSHWLVPQGVVGGRFAAAQGIPHVATAHGTDLLGLRFPGTGAALRYAARRSDLITVNSVAMKEALRSRVGEAGARVVRIGARIPEPGCVEGNLELRGSLPRAEHILGFVGRVVEAKGILEFVRAVAALREEGESVAGLVVGGGGAEADARRLADELGVGDALRFVGAVPPERVPRHMSVIDVLAVPSRYEAQGLVAIEAMLLGVPVVAFETGGLREVVRDGESGLAVEPGDVAGLTRAAGRLLHDRALRRRLAEGGRRRALEEFTLDAAADSFAATYRELLEG